MESKGFREPIAKLKYCTEAGESNKQQTIIKASGTSYIENQN